MGIMRHGDKPSTDNVMDDYGKMTEQTNDITKKDTSKVKFVGIADSFDYGKAVGYNAKDRDGGA